MNPPIVLCHIGKSIPNHLELCINQIKIWSDKKIYIIYNTEIENEIQQLCNKYNIIGICTNAFPEYKQIEEKTNHPHWDFWNVTFRRFYYLRDCFEKNLFPDGFIHFDNDVLIYDSLDNKEIINLFKTVKENNQFSITCGSRKDLIAGFSYIPSKSSLDPIIEFIDNTISLNFERQFNLEMCNEMVVLRLFQKQYPNKIYLLPILPYEVESVSTGNFNFVFDPASYGQFFGGTPHNGKRSGYTDNNFYIGEAINCQKIIPFVGLDNNRRQIPMVSYTNEDGVTIIKKIMNLHIHSKELNKFITTK